MEQQDAPPITAKMICDRLGRRAIAEHIGASLTAVSNAATDGKFPARWYRGIRDLCLAVSCPCPDEVFNFIVPVEPSGDARDVA